MGTLQEKKKNVLKDFFSEWVFCLLLCWQTFIVDGFKDLQFFCLTAAPLDNLYFEHFFMYFEGVSQHFLEVGGK
jgi:hypothetical protein